MCDVENKIYRISYTLYMRGFQPRIHLYRYKKLVDKRGGTLTNVSRFMKLIEAV